MGTWQKAFETAQAGDTVYFRGGVYYPTAFAIGNSICAVSPDAGIGQNGEPNNRICFFNYPGETPILDCSKLTAPPANQFGDGNRYIEGLNLYDAHWLHFRGLTIRNVYQREENVRVRGVLGWPISNMIFEQMTIHNIGGEGWYMHSSVNVTGEGFGWDNSGFIPYDTTRFINCDTYQCCDTLPANIGNEPGNMGDGMKLISYPKAHIVFSGCRVWHCSDDGVDMPGSATKVFENCWSFNNNYPGYSFEGNGFKIGGNNDTTIIGTTFHNNISAFNGGAGLYEVEYPDYVRTNGRIYNNTIYKCGRVGISASDNINYPDSRSIYRNNIVYGIYGKDAIGRPYDLDMNFFYSESNNTWEYAENGSLPNWIPSTSVTVDDNDFVLTDSVQAIAQLTAPRKANGSLPEISFLKLVEGSDLIDAGLNVGLPYAGSTPDIGAFEYGLTSGIKINKEFPGETLFIQNYPNPFSTSTTITYQLSSTNQVILKVIDMSGRVVATLVDEVQQPGYLSVRFEAGNLESGIYFYSITAGTYRETRKFIVSK